MKAINERMNGNGKAWPVALQYLTSAEFNAGGLPFALRCDGQQVDDWQCRRGEGSIALHSAAAGLDVSWIAVRRGAGWEFECRLANPEKKPSGLLDGIEFFRLRLPIAADDLPVVHHSGGGLTDAVFPSSAWRVKRTELPDWAALRLEGDHGRSSNKDLPLFILSDDRDQGGLAFVVGYSGNVVTTILRDVDYRSVLVTCSVRGLQLRLPPGESVRLGSVLVVPYEGDIHTGRNLLRRTLREQICPASPGGRVRPEVTYVHWFGIENKFTAATLLREADTVAGLGAEVFEADAGVFLQGTHEHYGAGNWGEENRKKFPEGLTSFADAIRARGMRFGLWCEPETVEAGTRIDVEHPEWLIRRPVPNDKRHLFDFSNPEAAAYMARLVGDMIETYGVQWSRVDSNLNPDEYWATIADPGERGFRELRHWEGWYRFLDALMGRFPNLHIEGCSSGGRRIDLEMLRRSHNFWISDNTNFAATVHQHIGGANRWLPSHLLNMEAVKYPLFPKHVRPYDQVGDETFSDFWLATLMGGLFGLGGPHSQYPDAVNQKFKRFIGKYKEIRHLLEGDFYPLLPQPSTSADWDAWQFHDPDSGTGLLLIFRMRGGPDTFAPCPRALDPERAYRLCFFPSARTVEMSGAALTGGELEIQLAPWGAEIVTYE
jgi:alpha-galactosidase